MDLGLKDKLAVVTGSTAGIGFAIAAALAREGAQVLVNGRTAARVETALQKIRQLVPSANGDHAAAYCASRVEISVVSAQQQSRRGLAWMRTTAISAWIGSSPGETFSTASP